MPHYRSHKRHFFKHARPIQMKANNNHFNILLLSLLFFTELIPRPARACQDPPLYLRLRMGKPIGKSIIAQLCDVIR